MSNRTSVVSASSCAHKDVATARANASIDREWAHAIAHQECSGRRMISAEGLRPRGRDQQRTVVMLVDDPWGEARPW
jgi:hypothetical protein